MKLGTQEFLGSLITNLNTKIQISKWRIQYGGSKCEKLLDLDETQYSGVFEVTDYESEHIF